MCRVSKNFSSCVCNSRRYSFNSNKHYLKPLHACGFYCVGSCLICSLFNDYVSNSNCVMSEDYMVVNNKWERMWKEAVMA